MKKCLLVFTLLTFSLMIPLPSQSNEHFHPKGSTKEDFSKPFITVAKTAIPAVVYIKVESGSEYSPYNREGSEDPFDFFNDDFFNRFFGSPKRRSPPKPSLSQGSGFIISPEGYIVTNYHVVQGGSKITVTLQNGENTELSATLVGGDEHTDVALLKITDPTSKPFPYLNFGDSDQVEVGELVVAVGNPFQLSATVTHGIISAKGRKNLQITDLEDFIQTDAPINPGNSGGPLLNLDAEVIGINTAIVSRSGGSMGIGFAIPSNIAFNIMNQLIDTGTVSRGFLGVMLQPIDSDLAKAFGLKHPEGALVTEVVEGSAAEKAGLKPGDIITEIDGEPVKTRSDLRKDILLLKPETKVTLTINRDGKVLKIPVTLGTHGANTMLSSRTNSSLLGLEVDNLTADNIKEHQLKSEESGVVIKQIFPDSPAAHAHPKLREGSVIVMMNKQPIKNVTTFKEALKTVEKGDTTIRLLVKEGELLRFHVITLK